VAIPTTVQVDVPEETSVSSFESTTGLISASAAATSSFGDLNARELIAETTSAASSDSSSSSSQSSSATSNASSASPSSIEPDAPQVSFVPDSGNDSLVSIPPYVCTTTTNLSTFTGQLLDYIQDTQVDILAHLLYVVINIHGAASANSPLSPAPSPSSLPQQSDNLGQLFLANLSDYIYTPDKLRSDRANLNESWYKVDSLHRPVDGYYTTQSSQRKC